MKGQHVRFWASRVSKASKASKASKLSTCGAPPPLRVCVLALPRASGTQFTCIFACFTCLFLAQKHSY